MPIPHIRGATVALAVLALSASGCGDSVDPALVTQSGRQGEALESSYSLLTKDLFENASTRKLKRVDAALKAGDLKRASARDVRLAQSEIRRRIGLLGRFQQSLAASRRTLRRRELPEFERYLGNSAAVRSFSADYASTTKLVLGAGAAGVTASRVVLTYLERYLEFLEQWEQYLASDDTAGLVADANASDRALAEVNRRKAQLRRRGDISGPTDRLIAKMAQAASEQAGLAQLIGELKKSYPDSFLAVHMRKL